MADPKSLSDDYVASLLVKDAKESAIKYSAMGMEAFLPSKTPANKPKPNTRFLRAIIKETDSHNATLLAKEAAESKARLQNLVTKEVRSGADIRRRQLGHITAHLTGGSTKRRKGEEEVGYTGRKRRRDAVEEAQDSKKSARWKGDADDDRKTSRSNGEDHHSRNSSHRRHRSRSEDHPSKSNRHVKNSSRRRSPSPREHRSTESRRNHRFSEHRTSSQRAEHDTEEDEMRSHRKRVSCDSSEKASRERFPKQEFRESVSQAQDEDSDPLDEIIGPRPPPKVRSRGRGLTSTASGIDERFSSNYDPSVDIQLDFDEENDWEQALEALRDRQKWRQQGADRLRAAGFTEEEVEKWEKGGEKKESDVKWAKKGEGREWDRGKVAMNEGEDNIVKDIDINYGRLKGT